MTEMLSPVIYAVDLAIAYPTYKLSTVTPQSLPGQEVISNPIHIRTDGSVGRSDEELHLWPGTERVGTEGQMKDEVKRPVHLEHRHGH